MYLGTQAVALFIVLNPSKCKQGSSPNLFVKQVQGQLKSNGLHVCLLQGRGDVHVHVKESLHGTTLKKGIGLIFVTCHWPEVDRFDQKFQVTDVD